MKFIFFVVFLAMLRVHVFAQNDFAVLTIRVSDEQTGLPVTGATLVLKETSVQFNSDKQGELKMALEFGLYHIVVSHNDYHPRIINCLIQSDTIINVAMNTFDKSVVIEEITINEKRPLKVNMIGTGIEMLESDKIGMIPTLGGEKDLIRSLALLPGIQTASEGSSNLVVRGGNPDQNLLLFNELPLYQTNHLFSMVSSVNPMLIDQVQVYKSGFPANYGGKTSSVVKVTTKLPDNKRFHVEGDIGLLSSNLLVSLPLLKNKLSVMACGRRTYLDLAARPFKNLLGNITFNFSDIYLSADWMISPKSKMFLFHYANSDVYKDLYDDQVSRKEISKNIRNWGNQLSGISWSFDSGSLTNYLSIGHSAYQMSITHKDSPDSVSYYERTLHSDLVNMLIVNRLGFKLNKYFTCEAGLQLDYFHLRPATYIYRSITDTSDMSRIESQRFYAAATWLSVDYTYKAFDLRIGCRGSALLYTSNPFFSSEPRIALRYALSKDKSIKASYARMFQPLHSLSNNGLGLPVDLWIGPDKNREPIVANHWSLGFYKNGIFKNKSYEFSIESFLKTTQNTISYLDGYSSAIFTSDTDVDSQFKLDDILTKGKGLSYGIELMLEKKEGPLTGWISYTYSKSLNAFESFENFSWYNSNYDRPHNLSIAGFYQLKAGWNFNFNFSLISGQPFSFPAAIYPSVAYNLIDSKPVYYGVFSNPEYIYRERNNIRLKTFHKIDLGFKKQFRHRGRYHHWIEFSIYNLYNYPNSTYGEIRNHPYSNRIEVVSVSLFPIIPGISYGFRF